MVKKNRQQKKTKIEWEKPTVSKLDLSQTAGKEFPNNEESSTGGKPVLAFS